MNWTEESVQAVVAKQRKFFQTGTTLDIDWRIPVERAILSEKDTKHLLLKDFDSPFEYNVELTNKL